MAADDTGGAAWSALGGSEASALAWSDLESSLASSAWIPREEQKSFSAARMMTSSMSVVTDTYDASRAVYTAKRARAMHSCRRMMTRGVSLIQSGSERPWRRRISVSSRRHHTQWLLEADTKHRTHNFHIDSSLKGKPLLNCVIVI